METIIQIKIVKDEVKTYREININGEFVFSQSFPQSQMTEAEIEKMAQTSLGKFIEWCLSDRTKD